MSDKKGDEAKKMEEQRKKFEEMQKQQMDEQKKMKKLQLDMTMKQLDSNRKIVECTIERLKADCEVMEKVEMHEEKNEVKKKAIKAKVAEMNALIENEKLKLEMIDLNKENVKAQLDNLDKMPMMPQQGMMGGRGPMM